jgi:hypothetical protein
MTEVISDCDKQPGIESGVEVGYVEIVGASRKPTLTKMLTESPPKRQPLNGEQWNQL